MSSTPPPTNVVPTVITAGRADSPGIIGVIAVEMTPFAQALVRGLRTYLMGVLGFLTMSLAGQPVLESIGVMIPADQFWGKLGAAAGLAVAPTVVSVLWNLVEILSHLDSRFPKARA